MAELRGGCLYGGHLARTQPQRHRGVQVFTYKELEVATAGFSEANVIGRGGFGVVYRGVLSDGTEAAIKVLHRAGKQGERAFRVEVSGLHLLAFILSFFVSLSLFQFFLAPKFCRY